MLILFRLCRHQYKKCGKHPEVHAGAKFEIKYNIDVVIKKVRLKK